jgi:Fe-S cluster biogenesis protein NfuA/nitrite reductase/ring-hydroxylating ferredoxin subunit
VTDALDMQEVGTQIEGLLTRLSSTSDPAVVQQVEELVGLLVDFYGAGLARVVEVVGERTVRLFAGDPLVASQLELHGLLFRDGERDAAAVPDTHELGGRVEELLAELTSTGEPAVVDPVEEIVGLLVGFYGEGLGRIVDMADEQTLGLLVDDPLVASQLILHELHPQSTEERVQAALEKVRPYLGSHSGDVYYRGIDADGVVQLALAGSCDGCPSSAVTVKLAIEKAIEDAAPEITGVEVAGMVRETPLQRTQTGDRKLLPISAVGTPAAPAAPVEEPDMPTWVSVEGLSGLDPGTIKAAKVGSLDTVVCNVAGTLYAYANRCPGCGGGLAGGHLDDGLLGCAGCGRRYDIRLAGRGASDRPEDAELHLDPLPLLADSGTVRVAVSTAGA